MKTKGRAELTIKKRTQLLIRVSQFRDLYGLLPKSSEVANIFTNELFTTPYPRTKRNTKSYSRLQPDHITIEFGVVGFSGKDDVFLSLFFENRVRTMPGEYSSIIGENKYLFLDGVE